MDIIWTSEEIKNINQILKKANLKVTEDNILVKINNNQKTYTDHILTKEHDALNKLFNLQDRKEILELLKNVIQVKEIVEKDNTNPFYFGFLSEIASINHNDITEIFNLYKSIATLYCKASNKLAIIIENETSDLDSLKEKLDEIKNSKEEAEEEKLIKDYINERLIYIRKIINNPILSEFIDIKNKEIKKRLITDLEHRYTNLKIKQRKKETVVYTNYANERANKLCRRKGIKPVNFTKG